MPRVKTGTVRRKAHKKTLQLAKGFRMARNRLIKVATEATLHAGQYAFNGRKERKQTMRITWISRINAALSTIDKAPKYSIFIKKLSSNKVKLNRKILANFATDYPGIFENIVFFTTKK